MGRKIPAKKHRGVKDPLKQREKRFALIKDKINQPPKDPDDQAIPKSLERVMKLKNLAKENNGFKKKKKKRSKLISLEPPKLNRHPKDRPEKEGPVFKQRPSESGTSFMHRVSRETEAFLNEAAFEKKYNVQVRRNPKTGKIIGVEKAPKHELDNILKLKAKHSNINKKKKKNENVEHLSKSQKKRQKFLAKKQQKGESDNDEQLQVHEKIQFGEVVHAPPELNIRPRNADKEGSAKPGKKNLLLHKMLDDDKESNEKESKTNQVDRTGKRKDLPIMERKKMERYQSDAIAAYRLLKSKKSSS